MNSNLNSQHQSQTSLISSETLSLAQVLKLLQVETSSSLLRLLPELDFKVITHPLGGEIYHYYRSQPANNLAQDKQKQSGFYVIFQGRVRLVSHDTEQAREVSVGVLEKGDIFGADDFCQADPLDYRAIAASEPVQLVYLPISYLEQWWERVPEFQTHLQQQAEQRSRLIFLKTLTNLRSLTSHQLKQVSSYLTTVGVPPGSSLDQVAPTPEGHYWLRHGQVGSPDSASPPPQMGGDWGYPQVQQTQWVAESPLQIYQLPTSVWSLAQLDVPDLMTLFPDHSAAAKGRSLDSAPVQGGRQPSIALRRSPPRLPQPSTPSARDPDSAPIRPGVSQDPPLIRFPRPLWQRHGKRWLGNRHPFIQQQSSSDCGAACLAMISQYWGKRFSLNTLRNLAGVGRAGASLKALAQAADSLGFQARPVRASLSRLVDQTEPWIAHWQGDHYVVVYRVKGDRVQISDPAVGRKTLSCKQFEQGWTGYALLLEPTAQLAAMPNEKTSLGRFFKVFWSYRSVLWQILVISLLIQVFGLVTPLFTQIILDRVVVQQSAVALNVFAIGLLLFGIWRIGMTAVRQYLLDYFSNRLDLTLMSGFVNHTLLLPLKFFESRHVGDIITRVQENQKIQLFLVRHAVTTWLDALMAVVYIGLMVYYNWQLTLLVIAMLPPIALLTGVASPFLRGASREIFNEAAGQNSDLVEMMTGVATVKAAASEREVRWRWEDRLTSMLNARFRGQKLANGLQIAGELINVLGSTALLWYGATLVIQEELTIGQFVAFNMLIGSVINPVLGLVGLWDELQEVLVSVERLDDIFTAVPEEKPEAPMMVLPSIAGEVEFDNVTFRYNLEDDRNTLQNLSLRVQAGQTIAIVGRSGSGKSTLVSLLQGLYHPERGRIFIDGHDVRHVSPQSLRSQLGVVPQECFLFSGTILENITLYRPNFTLEQVVEVAKLAEAHAFIQTLPLGYNTKVGERGSTLSGGQRQRIAIARALLGSPRILILDEATSSLDTESERRFQQNLTRISRDRTTFIIAHRLSTVRHADCILVLDKGVLVERGTHTELMAEQGLYYHLAQQQLDL